MRKLLTFTRENVKIDQMISKSSVQNEWRKIVLYAHCTYTTHPKSSSIMFNWPWLRSSVQHLHQQLKLGQREIWPGGRFLAQKFTEWRAKHFGGQLVTLPENVLVFSYQRTRWWIRCNGARQLSEQTEFHIYFRLHWLFETHRTDRESEKQFGLKTWHTKTEPITQNWIMLRAEPK